jgi:hypothetical protein
MKPNMLLFSVEGVNYSIPLNGLGEMMGNGQEFESDFVVEDSSLVFCSAGANDMMTFIEVFTLFDDDKEIPLKRIIYKEGINKFHEIVQDLYKDNFV